MRRPGRALRGLVLASLAVLAACGSAPERPAAPARPPADFPADAYARAAAGGEPVHRVDTARSLVTLAVGRAGSLARLGHDHVIASRSVRGEVAPGLGRADLYVPLAELTVDEPALRAQAGLDTRPTEVDVEGTRSNMLNKVLRVREFPYALVHVSGLDPRAAFSGRVRAAVSVTLLGTTRTADVPLDLAATPDGIAARGAFELKQSDFGIVPFSLFGGALQVRDEVQVRFDIRTRLAGPPSP